MADRPTYGVTATNARRARLVAAHVAEGSNFALEDLEPYTVWRYLLDEEGQQQHGKLLDELVAKVSMPVMTRKTKKTNDDSEPAASALKRSASSIFD